MEKNPFELGFGLGKKKSKNKRKIIKQSIKNEVLSRQKNRCYRCENPLDMRAVHFDHIIPISEGGTNDSENLQALCPTCHQKKTHEDNMRKRLEKKQKPKRNNYGFGLGKGFNREVEPSEEFEPSGDL